jgi:hypothetical protein
MMLDGRTLANLEVLENSSTHKAEVKEVVSNIFAKTCCCSEGFAFWSAGQDADGVREEAATKLAVQAAAAHPRYGWKRLLSPPSLPGVYHVVLNHSHGRH